MAIKVLEKIPKERFDMEFYFEGDVDFNFSRYEAGEYCNTVGCALGSLATSELDVFKVNLSHLRGYRSKNPGAINWKTYGAELFPFLYPTYPTLGCHSPWDFLFSNVWSSHDNTLQGAIQRIALVLNKGFPWVWDYSEYSE